MASKENNVYSRFIFCGKVTVSKKVPFVKRDTYDKGEKISINFVSKSGTISVMSSWKALRMTESKPWILTETISRSRGVIVWTKM